MKIKKIWSRCYKEGVRARNETPEKQSIIKINLKEWLEATKEQWINTWTTIGSYYTTKRKELIERLPIISRGIPYEVHRENYKRGIIFGTILLLITFAEFWLLLWTLRPFGLGLEIYLISFVIMSTGMLAVHFFLNKIKDNNPKLYNKLKLYITAFSLIAILLAGLSLAIVRGHLMEIQREVQGNPENFQQAETFYKKTVVPVTVSMALIAVSLSLIGGVVLHETLSKLIISGNVVRTYRKAEDHERRIIHASNQVEIGKQIIKLGMVEFNRGLYLDSDRGSWLMHLCIFLLFMLPVLGTDLNAGERQVIYVLLDQSKSTLCEVSKENQFRKNLTAVPAIINQAPPGSMLRIIGITNSFGSTSILLKSSLPSDSGTFGEKVGLARKKIIQNWNSLSLSPSYSETDIIGALFFVSTLMEADSSTTKLVIISDMRNSVGINVEDLPVVGDKAVQEAERIGLIPDLFGARIYCIGVSPCGKSLKYWQSLKNFWKKYFDKTGAELVCFSIDRDLKLGTDR